MRCQWSSSQLLLALLSRPSLPLLKLSLSVSETCVWGAESDFAPLGFVAELSSVLMVAGALERLCQRAVRSHVVAVVAGLVDQVGHLANWCRFV